jgi:DNA-binding NarL/FixJ family response regulator
MKQIRILIADDHTVVRSGLISYLTCFTHLQVVGEATDGLDAIAKARALLPDVILMDIEMPKLNGLSATEILHRENPVMKIIFLSAHPSKEYASRLPQSGAAGFFSKRTPMPELAKAIEMVAWGKNAYVTNVPMEHLERRMTVDGGRSGPRILSARERAVLVAVAEGLSNKEIATRLEVGVRTVETYRERITHKLNIYNTAGLTRFAIAEGLVSLS